MDRRNFPANDRVACESLRGRHPHHTYVVGTHQQVVTPLTDLRAAPNGSRERQLILGDDVTVYDEHDGWSFVRAVYDGYVGYVQSTHLGTPRPVTHWVIRPLAHAYSSPDFKSPEIGLLPMGARLRQLSEEAKFIETPNGWIPKPHIAPLTSVGDDPVAVAQQFVHTPYLWGGNTALGIDCSGLVQLALRLCGIAAPADSDQQMDRLGYLATEGGRERNDLLFWRGHVAWVLDADHILHANAFHMRVSIEMFDTACVRIKAQGDGEMIAHKRLSQG